MANATTGRVAAKKVLEAAKKHASKDVIVVSKASSDGDLYLATSMPSGTSQALEAQIKLVNEALKSLRRIQRQQVKREQASLAKREARA